MIPTVTRPKKLDKPKPKTLITLILLISIIAAISSTTRAGDNSTGPANKWGSDPLNATYLIAGEVFQLINGQCKAAAAPGSASMIKIRYADRHPNEPLSATPSVAKQSVLIVSNDLLEVVSLK